MNSAQDICPRHMKTLSNTYMGIYIGHMSWTYVLDRVSQGCICIGQQYMSWNACDPRHITCHPIYIMFSKIYVLDDTYILDNIAYVMENMYMYIGYVNISWARCICIGYIYWTTRHTCCPTHIHSTQDIYPIHIPNTYETSLNEVYILGNVYIYWVYILGNTSHMLSNTYTQYPRYIPNTYTQHI